MIKNEAEYEKYRQYVISGTTEIKRDGQEIKLDLKIIQKHLEEYEYRTGKRYHQGLQIIGVDYEGF